jgi:hypothetical protein
MCAARKRGNAEWCKPESPRNASNVNMIGAPALVGASGRSTAVKASTVATTTRRSANQPPDLQEPVMSKSTAAEVKRLFETSKRSRRQHQRRHRSLRPRCSDAGRRGRERARRLLAARYCRQVWWPRDREFQSKILSLWPCVPRPCSALPRPERLGLVIK